MIRYAYINNQVLNIYYNMQQICFPINIHKVIELIPNCRYMSYQKFAQVNGCTINDVIQICESQSGCTQYDVLNNRYLILCNQSTKNNNNIGRQRWTCSHEIGHIICKHLDISAYNMLSENGFIKDYNPEFEAEADYFAATLLSPFPLFKLLNIRSKVDIQNIFGLSCKASDYRYNQYIKWCNNRIKTSWENDMIKIYKYKNDLI